MGDVAAQLRQIAARARILQESVRVDTAIQLLRHFQGVIEEVLQRLSLDQSFVAWFCSSPFSPNNLHAWLSSKEIEIRNADLLVQKFLQSGVEIRNASFAFQGNEFTPIICFFFKGFRYTDPFLSSLKICLGLTQETVHSLPESSNYGSPEQVNLLFEYQRLFLHYARAQGTTAIKFVAADAPEVEGLSSIVLRETGGFPSQVFIPPGEPCELRVQVSSGGAAIEVHWNRPVIGGNYLDGFLVSSIADSDPPNDWKYTSVASSPCRFPLPVSGYRHSFKVS